MSLAQYRPTKWDEDIQTTLAIILDEAISHTSEYVIMNSDDEAEVELVAAFLRARAVALGAEVERLQRRVRALENQHR